MFKLLYICQEFLKIYVQMQADVVFSSSVNSFIFVFSFRSEKLNGATFSKQINENKTVFHASCSMLFCNIEFFERLQSQIICPSMWIDDS